MSEKTMVSSIPPPPGTESPPVSNGIVQPPLPQQQPQLWGHQYYANFNPQYHQQYYQYYMSLNPYYAHYQQAANMKKDGGNTDQQINPPLPPGPPLPNTPPPARAPLLNTPKQFGNIRFQLNGKRLPTNNAMLQTQLSSSPNSGAAKKKRKRNRNNQMQLNSFNTPPLPPPENTTPKPAPPPELPPSPPLPPLPDAAPPPPPASESPAKQNAVPDVGANNPAGDWPQSLKDYVQRSYAKCKTAIDKNQVEIILKGKITQAFQNNQMYKDWSKEPLPNIHSERALNPVKPVPGLLAQYQNHPTQAKKLNGLSPAMGARLGARASTLRGKSRSKSHSRSRSPSYHRSRSRSRSPRRHRSSTYVYVLLLFRRLFFKITDITLIHNIK